tara:strand:+ start:5271 stop:6131 length:861 start_codon:yes stop_codon:yes gene_type:complete
MENFEKISDERLTVLVNSCDLYNDVWPLFFSALGEFWPSRSFKLVLNTETLAAPNVNSVVTKNFNPLSRNNSWGLRLREALQSIDTEYVLVLFDDFILEAPIDECELKKNIDRMDKDKDIAAIYLTALGLETQNVVCESFDYKYRMLQDKIDFRLNSAPAIWRRIDLLQYTGEHDNPWAWEVFGSYRTYGDGKKMYCPASSDNDVYVYNHSKGGAIYRGRWVSEVVVEKDEKYKLFINFEERGFSESGVFEKRTFGWKVNFMILGFRMVRFKSFLFVFRSLKSKIL